MTDPIEITAHHEAAHAVVNYRAAGFVGGDTTVVPDAQKGILGASGDAWSDSFNQEHMRARILSCYAGAHADRALGFDSPCQCEQDEEIASELLRRWGWENREQEFRDESRALVDKHWAEIVAVAEELQRVHTLDDTEVEFIAEIAAGDTDVTLEHLERYRVLRGNR